jgi:hypothetical protein
MTVDSGQVCPVSHDDAVAVSQFVATPDDNATRSCHDRRSGSRHQIDSVMLKLLSDYRMLAHAKW